MRIIKNITAIIVAVNNIDFQILNYNRYMYGNFPTHGRPSMSWKIIVHTTIIIKNLKSYIFTIF